MSCAAASYGLRALFVDVNNDGKPDLVVANDSTPNYLYVNKGDGTFDDQSLTSGYAFNGDGREVANMGIAAGDYENNGHMNLVTTTFSDDYDVLFQNDGTETSPTLATKQELGRRLCRLSDLAMVSSIMTTTGGRIC